MSHSGKPVEDISIWSDTPVEKIFEQISKSGGFESRHLAESLDTLTALITDDNCPKFSKISKGI